MNMNDIATFLKTNGFIDSGGSGGEYPCTGGKWGGSLSAGYFTSCMWAESKEEGGNFYTNGIGGNPWSPEEGTISIIDVVIRIV